MSTIDSLSVIIPAFNETQSLQGATAELVRELGRLEIPFEIIIVDDGSDDGSVDVLARLSAAEPRITVLRHATNRGKGSALRTGLAAASFEWILLIDADLQVPLRELEAFDRASRDADILIGYRCDKKYAFKRRIISAVYKFVVRILFGIHARDVGCPFKLLRTDVVRSIQLSTNGFGFDVELLWRLSQAGFGYIELPVVSIPRQAGESKVTLRRIVLCMVELLQLWSQRDTTA